MTSAHTAGYKTVEEPALREPETSGTGRKHFISAASLVQGCSPCRHSWKDNRTQRQLSLCWKAVQMQETNEESFLSKRKEDRTDGPFPPVSSLNSGRVQNLPDSGSEGQLGRK